jgi:hypothetical protein
MAVSLVWKEKVVRSIAITIVLFHAAHLAHTQPVTLPQPQKKISWNCNALAFDKVVDHLSGTTGFRFIYSPSKIDAKKRVSLSVSNKPLGEVLALIGRQTDLDFRIQGRHIIIKNLPSSISQVKPVATRQRSNPSFSERAQLPNRALYQDSIRFALTPEKPTFKNSIALSSNADYTKYLTRLQPYFDSTLLKNTPVQYIRKTNYNNSHQGWFIAAGARINDYSAGLELRAGIRSVYVAYSPSWLNDGRYTGGYGLGTSLLLSRNFSFSPQYTYATVKEKHTIILHSARSTAEHNINLLTRQHQVKLMVQYAISRNISILAGPTFNYAKATRKFTNFIAIGGSAGDGMIQGEDYSYAKTAYPLYNTARYEYHYQLTTARPVTSPAGKYWIGWEAILLFKVNFSHRR